MAGKSLKELGFTEEIWPSYWAVKESVFPFNKFLGQDIILSPEMRSTGEVMGLDADLGVAYAKSQMAANSSLPFKGGFSSASATPTSRRWPKWRSCSPIWASN
jgi:carbamoyl-phosphate synthase large subunit